MILTCEFCVYLQFTPLFTSWHKQQSTFLQNTNRLQVKNFALKVNRTQIPPPPPLVTLGLVLATWPIR